MAAELQRHSFTIKWQIKNYKFFSNSHNYSLLSTPWITEDSLEKNEVYELEAGRFLIPDTLTIQCRLYEKQGLVSEDGEHTVITEMEMKRMSFMGVVENFNDLKCGQEKDVIIRSTSDESLEFSINIGLTNNEIIFVQIIPLNYENIQKCSCVLFLLDGTKNGMKSGEGEFLFNNRETNTDWIVPIRYTKGNLMELGTKYFPEDSLSFQCKLTIFTGESESKSVKTIYGVNLSKCNENPVSGREENSLMLTLQDDLMSLLSSGMFSDTKLRAVKETFPAHKNILSARSSVFKAILATNTNDCVEFEDLDADTMRRLLLFMYSDNLQDLDFESAKKLYHAGDMYEVLTLKHKCSHFLLENLCTSSCCDVLMLADRHSDTDLKKAVQEYIAQPEKEVLQTGQWKLLEKTNPHLALETFHIICQRNI